MEQNGPGNKRDRSRTNIPVKAPLFAWFLFSINFIWYYIFETFEKHFPLIAGFKTKSGDPAISGINHRHTLSISRINPPKFGGGLKFEPNAGIGQKWAFFKGLTLSL